MKAGASARRAALEILRRVREGQAFDTARRDLELLPDADRRLAHEIAAGVLRHRTELDGGIRPLVRAAWRNVEPDLKDLLRIGAYQLRFLDRVPDYAAVTATVEATGATHGSKAAGLVNAVLRRVATTPATPSNKSASTPPVERLAAEHSHPEWLVKRWIRRFGIGKTSDLLQYNNRRPRVVIQPVGWSTDQLCEALARAKVLFSQSAHGPGIVVRETAVRELPGYSEGAFIVQDPSQALLLEFARVPPGAIVWDACASPGGKAAMLSVRHRVVASELSRSRLDRLQDTLARVAPATSIIVADARQTPVNTAKIDVTLVDTPCSATGTLARHPDGRWKLSEDNIVRMAKRQSEILDGASQAVNLDKLLVYLTCSLEPEENEQQVDQFLERHPTFERDGKDCFLFPPDSGTDGGYAARLRRSR